MFCFELFFWKSSDNKWVSSGLFLSEDAAKMYRDEMKVLPWNAKIVTNEVKDGNFF